MAAPDQSHHVTALDGLRGIAATIVLLRHTFNAVVMPPDVRRGILESPLAPLLNGQGAVQLFFVLSGFVLAMSLSRDTRLRSVPAFYAKRILRIQPAYMGAVLFAWVASFFYVQTLTGDGLTLWLRRSAEIHLELPQLLWSLIFTGSAFGQLPVGWTLRIELVFSFLLPLLALLGRRGYGLVLIGLSLFALALGMDWNTLWYGFDFVLGVLLFQYRLSITTAIRALPAFVSVILFLASVAVFASPILLGWSTPGLGTLIAGFSPLAILLMGLGAFGILACALSLATLARALSIRPFRYLGRISYSLYLTHRTVLVLATPLVSPPVTWVDGVVLVVAVIALSILASEVLYWLAERPGIALGRQIAARTRADS